MKKFIVSLLSILTLFFVGCAGVPNNPVKFTPNAQGLKNGINAPSAPAESGIVIPTQQAWVANDNPTQWVANVPQGTAYTLLPQDAPMSGTFAEYVNAKEIAQVEHETTMWSKQNRFGGYGGYGDPYNSFGYGGYSSTGYRFGGAKNHGFYGGGYDYYPYGTVVPYWKDLQCPPTTRTRFSYSEGYVNIGGRVSIGGNGHGNRRHHRR